MTQHFQRIYELNTRVWLWELTAQGDMPRPDLAQVPPTLLHAWQRWQIDAIWLMGVWEASPVSARLGRENPQQVAEFRHVLDDFVADDCIGSPYAVRGYHVSPDIGGLDGLLTFRERLRAAGIGLLLDFVPNHTACDHPWVTTHPEYYVQGSALQVQQEPQAYFPATTTSGAELMIAHGRDPYFFPWIDTAQLNYSNPAVHGAMQAELQRIAQWCDGVRCDMAMLLLPEVFARTWSHLALPPPPDFWSNAMATVRQQFPAFCFIAEVYWHLEAQLQQRGFTFTYEKEFGDALVEHDVARLRSLLRPERLDLNGCLRFLENHDEPRAATRFSTEQHTLAALALLTLPGAVLLHDGQLEGRQYRTPVHLRRQRAEAPQSHLQTIYERLLALPKVAARVFVPLQPRSAWENNETFRDMLAWAWWNTGQLWLVVMNYAATSAQCWLDLTDVPLPASALRLHDHFQGVTYARWREELYRQGLYIDLPAFGSHVFEVTGTYPGD